MEQVQHCTDLPHQVMFPAHTELGKMGPRVRMNVAAYQEKEKNENMKMGKRKADERRQAIDFKEVVCYPFAIIQWAA